MLTCRKCGKSDCDCLSRRIRERFLKGALYATALGLLAVGVAVADLPVNPGPPPPTAFPRTYAGCTVGTSSGQCLASGLANHFLQVENTSSAANIACNPNGGTAVLNSSSSIQLGAGQSASWGQNTYGVPVGPINCIASASSTPLYLEYN